MAGEPLICVVGNLVADPEPRISQSGKPWVTFRIASTPRVRDKQSGDWADGEPLWVGCRAYGQEADNIAASFSKGDRVMVLGRLSQRSYVDKQGHPRTSLELEVEEVAASVKFATVQVQRSQRTQQASGGSWGAGVPQQSPGVVSSPQGAAQGTGGGQSHGSEAWESEAPF